ncbi:MAG: enoyl-CoA hydratase/isomerase family protein, partial [Burkholderiales bacterium]|nr:enoyl-CoA hydratase/isomerase family protein [Burkholderiales bacterium]
GYEMEIQGTADLLAGETTQGLVRRFLSRKG